jgi:hypothetical protein
MYRVMQIAAPDFYLDRSVKATNLNSSFCSHGSLQYHIHAPV